MIVYGVWALTIILIIHTIIVVNKFLKRDYSVLPVILNNLAIFIFILYGTIISLNEGRIQKVYGYLNNQEGLRYIWIIMLYIISFNLVFYLIKRTPFSFKKNKSKSYKSKIALFLAISYLPFLFRYGLSVSDYYSWGRADGDAAFTTIENVAVRFLATALSYFIIPTIILIFTSHFRTNSGRVHWKLVLPAINLFIVYLFTGGRTGVVTIVLVTFIWWLVNSQFVGIRTIIITLLITSTLWIGLTLQVTRRYGDLYNSTATSGLAGSNLNLELAEIISTYPKDRDFVYFDGQLPLAIGYSFFRTVAEWSINPIPRIIWQDKPYDLGFTDYNLYRLGNEGRSGGSNITPTVIGRYYLKYGLGGVLVSAALIAIFSKWSLLALLRSIQYGKMNLVMTLLLVLLSLSFRDLTPGRFYPLLMLIFINKFR